MSTVNAVTIYAENLQGANLVVGNTSSNLTVTANTISISIGSNVSINSTAIKVGNATHNTTINATALTTNSITINTVSYTKVVGETVLVDYQVFTNPLAANFWYKPAWAQANDIVTIQMWGGGGGGFSNTTISAAGGGGACLIVNKLAGECNSVCNVVVGAGGLGANGVNLAVGAAGTAGQTSIFWTNSTFSISAYGGGSGGAGGGGGGGWFSTGVSANLTAGGAGGSPLGGAVATPGAASTFGGGGGANSGVVGNGGISVYGGGGGSTSGGVAGGNTIYGGAGGSAQIALAISVFGGNGGNNTISAAFPGGGGSCITSPTANVTGMNGARGEVRIWITGQAR